MLDGGVVPGLKLVQGKSGARQWSDPEEAEKLLKSFRLKVDEMYDMKIISPTTAEKVLKEHPKQWKKAEALVVRPPGKLAVVPVSDKREAVTVTPVIDGFADVSADDLV
jgi:hypothetical protein